MSDKTYYIEYFKEMRNEINTRIKTHTQFINWKIISIGAIFSFLIKIILDINNNTKSGGLLLVVVIAGFALLPLISILFDIMIAKNINNIHKIGCFIKSRFELDLFDKPMWESYLGQADIEHRCYNEKDLEVISLFTKTVFIVSIIGSLYCILSPIIEMKDFNLIIKVCDVKRNLWILIAIEVTFVVVVYCYYYIRLRHHLKELKELITESFEKDPSSE